MHIRLKNLVWLAQGHRQGLSSTSVVSRLPLYSYKMIVKTTECLAPDGIQLLLINCDTSRARSRERHT